jgi:hypothetical protein
LQAECSASGLRGGNMLYHHILKLWREVVVHFELQAFRMHEREINFMGSSLSVAPLEMQGETSSEKRVSVIHSTGPLSDILSNVEVIGIDLSIRRPVVCVAEIYILYEAGREVEDGQCFVATAVCMAAPSPCCDGGGVFSHSLLMTIHTYCRHLLVIACARCQ